MAAPLYRCLYCITNGLCMCWLLAIMQLCLLLRNSVINRDCSDSRIYYQSTFKTLTEVFYPQHHWVTGFYGNQSATQASKMRIHMPLCSQEKQYEMNGNLLKLMKVYKERRGRHRTKEEQTLFKRKIVGKIALHGTVHSRGVWLSHFHYFELCNLDVQGK